MKKIIFLSLILVISINVAVATSTYTITPLIKPPVINNHSTYIRGQIGTVVYQITNNLPMTFTSNGLFESTNGITFNTNSVANNSQYCTNPFILTPGSSCLLKIQLNTSELASSYGPGGPLVCPVSDKKINCSQPLAPDQLSFTIAQTSIPQDCESNYANFNYELYQSLDSSSFTQGWGPGRNVLSLSPANPDLTNCPTTADVSWQRQRIVAAAAFWIAQKLSYCHHYNPDYATPPSGRNAGKKEGGYCNPVVDIAPGTFYYGKQARWNYSGSGGETLNNWVNNNQMWRGMDCSNYTAFLYNFAFGVTFDSKTGFQAGQQSTGCVNNVCPQDDLSPNTQIPSNPAKVLDNPNAAGKLVCTDGTLDPDPSHPSMCVGHGGYLSAIDSAGHLLPDGSITATQLASVLQPGDLLFIAGDGVNPDGSFSIVTHVVMWLGIQAGIGPNPISTSSVAPDDICADPSLWQAQKGDWLITDSHYQGPDYRKLTACFYLNHLWGVRRVIY